MGGVLVRAISVVESTREYRERRGVNNTASADPRGGQDSSNAMI